MASSTKVGILTGGLALASASILAIYKSIFPADDYSRR